MGSDSEEAFVDSFEAGDGVEERESGDRGRRPCGPRPGLSVARAEGRARPGRRRATQGERQEDLGKLFRIEFQATSTHSTLDRLSDMRFTCGVSRVTKC